jgi:hypothetical protein
MRKQLFAISVIAVHAVAHGQSRPEVDPAAAPVTTPAITPATTDTATTSPTAAPAAAPLDPDAIPPNRWHLQTSLLTHHFHFDAQHNDNQGLVNLEYWRADNWLAGAAWFKNSFHQPTQYVYIGKQWRPFDSQPSVYLKLTGGLLHGYKDEFRDKIPLNHSGVAPVLIPAIGYSTRRFSTELILFGTAGIMWNVGVFLN